MGKMVLGNQVEKKKGWSYNPRMKRWVRRKRRGRGGFDIKTYRRKAE